MANTATPAQLIKLIISLLQMRESHYSRALQESILEQRWSHLAGTNAIIESLKLAQATLREEAPKLKSRTDFEALVERFKESVAVKDLEREKALGAKDYCKVTVADGAGTGWLIAYRVIQEEIRALSIN